MFTNKNYKNTVKKTLKAEGHSCTSTVMIRLKHSKERDFLVDSSRA
ncbi:MAG: hypothetical protein OEW60_04600 [Thiovulaceae bacterium]|nr:hypothetical protein [Sulfurimonadaceae bacterium]